MANSCNVLLVAEGSGGHVIPALQVAQALAARGARIKVWYAKRRPIERLMDALTQQTLGASIDVDPMLDAVDTGLVGRLWRCGRLWRQAQRCFDTFAPDVVVGFGGWVSAPVVLAARLRRVGFGGQAQRRRIKCLLHEQNVLLGKANRWLAPWVDRVAVSFDETERTLRRVPPHQRRWCGGLHAVTTGLPVRQGIGGVCRDGAAARFGFSPDRPTLLVLGGSQGARAINRLMIRAIAQCSSQECDAWQIVHLTGTSDEDAVRQAYADRGVHAWVAPFLIEMEAAYAQADLAIARAGASTITELARCALPAILIPYPHAGGHQRVNAQLVEAVGGGVMLEESEAAPEPLLRIVRCLLNDATLRRMMGAQVRTLQHPDASQRLSNAILEMAGS